MNGRCVSTDTLSLFVRDTCVLPDRQSRLTYTPTEAGERPGRGRSTSVRHLAFGSDTRCTGASSPGCSTYSGCYQWATDRRANDTSHRTGD